MDGGVIGFLRGGETGLVDAVVDAVIDTGVHRLDLIAQGFGPVIVAVPGQPVEGGIEHADDLRAFVRHDGAARLVPKDRHRHPARRVGLGAGVYVPQEGRAEKRVARRAGKIGAEGPAVVQHVWMYDGNADHLFQPFERAEDQRAMRPGAGVGDIEVIAPRLGPETAGAGRAGRAVRRDPVAELRRVALERTARGGGVIPAAVPCAVDELSHADLLFARAKGSPPGRRTQSASAQNPSAPAHSIVAAGASAAPPTP